MSPELAQRIFSTPATMGLALLAVLTAFLLAAAWSDLQRRRIPNLIVFPGALLALALHSILPAGDGFLGLLPGGLGLLDALTGLAFGLVALLPLYLVRAMGAGDVKLMAMVGAFLGPVHIWPALFATAMAGGALAVFLAVRHGILGRTLINVGYIIFGRLASRFAGPLPAPTAAATPVPAARLPYAVAIAAGSIGYMIYRAQLAGLY